MKHKVRPGSRYPPGATPDKEGVNFSVFSRNASRVDLLLFPAADSLKPFQEIRLDPYLNRTFFFWHVYVEGLRPGVHYAWRVDGPRDPDPKMTGFSFDRRKELVDPWAKAVTSNLWDRSRACRPKNPLNRSFRGVVVDSQNYDWEGDKPLRRSGEQSVIYELHVRGFTRHPSSGVRYPGTFQGIIEKIPYLKELGITDVELMPVMAFDEQDLPENTSALGLKNYWGYSTHSFFSPHPGYCVSPAKGTHLREFRDMVKALHKAGIGVILDVVFGHTAEGGKGGPIINFKGFGNEIFYHLDAEDRTVYRDYTGCGNTVNCNHPMVARYLLACLEFWVNEMHVDGFRFDLASVLSRGEDGQPMHHAPILWAIEFSNVLLQTQIIAEAWDAGGLYQVGGFPGFRWAEWNGLYRDVMRRFVHGERGLVGEVATRLTGSSDLYEKDGRLPTNSVNFVTCHDGFTLHDLLSYNRKHNEANGEENRDGGDFNHSYHYGFEGETNNPAILSLRRHQAKNFFALLLLSHGVPMILAGDEVLRTQSGNNNAYCQDNETSWFNWRLLEKNREMFRFVKQMIAFRKRHGSLQRRRFLTGKAQTRGGIPDVTWHGQKLGQPPWTDREAQTLAYTLAGTRPGEEDMHVMINMSDHLAYFEIPGTSKRKWYRAVDTSLPSPMDIKEPADQDWIPEARYPLLGRSIVVLESRSGSAKR